MRFYRSARTRLLVSALALLALVLQSFVLGQHGAAMASENAEASRLSADLAALGLTLDDLPCHSNVLDGDETGKGTQPGKTGKTACPICTLHSSPLAAVLPAGPAVFISAEFREALPLPVSRVTTRAIRYHAQARAPPRGA